MNKIIIAVLCAVINFTAAAQKKNIKTETFKVLGTCEQCKARIETALKNIGTYKANWVIETNMLTVSFDSTKLSKTKISKKLAAVGHDNEEFKTDEKTYNSLPKCCYYDREVKTILFKGSIDSLIIEDNNRKNTSNLVGIVLAEDERGDLAPAMGASVRNIQTNRGIIADTGGTFKLPIYLPAKIEVGFVGYKKDTVIINSFDKVKIVLKYSNAHQLKEVIFDSRKPSTYISKQSTLNTLNIGTRELTKAACCNLSESFETSPSVDVSYTDAVTGIKQIQLLGLSGNYIQLTTENTPEIRGLAGSYGLTFIPGPWVEGIQVTKGTGSVANGFESIAGQINIEEKKPDKMERLFINTYANDMGRLETNINLSQKINSKWSTALLTHANAVITKNDANKDGFLDIPVGRQFNIINRWRYADEKGLFAQLALKALNDKRQSGENDFNEATDKLTNKRYGVGINVKQYALSGKFGYVFPEKQYKSIGFIFSANAYSNNAYYGLTKYDAKQHAVYANLMYQSIIHTTTHKFRTGISLMNDNYNEDFNTTNFRRKEIVPGTFFEYTYTATEKFTAIAGIRLDYHNQFKLITTPRLHMKYDFSTKTNLRFSVGSGTRTANIIAENTGLLASSRVLSIVNPSSNYGYGLDQEKAWNVGFNFVHNFRLNNQSGTFSVDAYRTVFKNQSVIDIDANPQQIKVYNLIGKSYSNSLQAEFNYELFKKFDIRLAYRWLDVKTNYSGNMLEKPLQAKHRAFINLAYETNNKWKFDFTTQWLSEKRLPNTNTNPIDKQMSNYSPSFIQMSGQVSKQLGSKWDVYVGAENLTNYTQQNLFIDGNNPFSKYFDGSMVWGPVNGRVVYVGMRFKIK